VLLGVVVDEIWLAAVSLATSCCWLLAAGALSLSGAEAGAVGAAGVLLFLPPKQMLASY
jgi:hypothetical protein